MKRFWILILTIFFLSTVSCAQKKKSTVERLKEQSAREALNKPRKKSSQVNKKIRQKKLRKEQISKPVKETIQGTEPSSKEEKQGAEKKIFITGKNIPLRKGPGSRFKQIGTANKGDSFSFVRSQRLPDEKQTWHLIKNKEGKSFFVSELFASFENEIIKRESGPSTQKSDVPPFSGEETENLEILQTGDKVAIEDIRKHSEAAPPLPAVLKEAKHITLNFEGTELYDVITTFCELLQIDYIIEGAIEGKVTLQTFNKIDVNDLYPVLEQILALHNITVTKSGNFYRFLPIEDSIKKPTGIYFNDDPSLPEQERMVLQIVSLQNISVEAAQKVLKPLLTENALFIEIPGSNNMMIAEMASNLKRLIKIVKALDIDKAASANIQLYRLANSDDEDVVEELKSIFTAMGFGDALDKTLTFLPLERMNSILVVNTIDSLAPTIDFWIEKLDLPVAEGDVSTFVYYVQHGDATTLSSLLNGVFKQSSSASALGDIKVASATKKKQTSTTNKKDDAKTKTQKKETTPKVSVDGGIKDELEGEITIIPDTDTNSLIIRTAPKNYSAILALIKKLDLQPQQVLIEVLIVDLTLDDSFRVGLESTYSTTKNGNPVGVSINNTTLGNALGSATASFLPGASFVISNPSKLVAQLRLFASDGKTDVLANPILVTSDNKAASISIADEIPVESASSTVPTGNNPVVTSTVEFKSVGIKLDIVPQINSDNFINLKINQEISSRGANIDLAGGGSSPSFSKREINTEVVLKDGQILIMGGLVRNDFQETVSGVPFLKDIPVLGQLFGTLDKTNKKTELMLFITPHIINNAEDSGYVTTQFKRRLGDFSKFVKN